MFLLYVNDLHHASKVLNSIMFADNRNLFFSHSGINLLFEKMSKALTNASNWFKAIIKCYVFLTLTVFSTNRQKRQYSATASES